MKFAIVSAAIAAFTTAAQAGVMAARQSSFQFECNGQLNPNASACTELGNRFEAGPLEFQKPGGNIEDTTWFTLGDSSNCRVEIFWNDSQFVLSREQLYQGIRAVSSTCFPYGAGGSAVDARRRYTITVRNNPTYDPPSKRSVPKRSGRGTRADGDTSFSYGIHTVYSKLGWMKHYVGPGLPGGSTWEWNAAQTVTDSTTFSTTVSSGIEKLLSASLATEISSSKSSTSGEATTISIKCQDNEIGQVYFQAYAETWSGVLLPSGQPLTVHKSMARAGVTEGFYSYDCIAK